MHKRYANIVQFVNIMLRPNALAERPGSGCEPCVLASSQLTDWLAPSFSVFPVSASASVSSVAISIDDFGSDSELD
jgi:hypothetical protein